MATNSFDSAFYLRENPDVAAAGVDPEEHFLAFGIDEHRDPNPFFDIGFYLEENPDVEAAGINPLDHFNSFGLEEGRDPNPLFDSAFYLRENPDVAAAGVNPFEHFLEHGLAEQRDFTPFFDTAFYLQQNPDVVAAGVNPLLHFLEHGFEEDRAPSEFFDPAFYKEQNPDVAAAGVNPFEHFLEHGIEELRDPNVDFDMAALAQSNANFQQAIVEGNTEVFQKIIEDAAEIIMEGGTFDDAFNSAVSSSGDDTLPPPPPPSSTSLPPPPSSSSGSSGGGTPGSTLPLPTVTGTPAAESLSGTSGNDIFAAVGGDDTLTGSGGADTFLSNSSLDGVDTLMDYDPSTSDKIILNGRANDYGFFSGSGSKLALTLLDAPNGGFLFDTIAFSSKHTALNATFAASVSFGDGAIIAHTASETMTGGSNADINIWVGALSSANMQGGPSEDFIQDLTNGANTLNGGLSDDELWGFDGNDRFEHGGAGYGIDEIGDYRLTGSDTLVMSGNATDYLFEDDDETNEVALMSRDESVADYGVVFIGKAYSSIATDFNAAMMGSISFTAGSIELLTATGTFASAANLNILGGTASAQTATGTTGNDMIQDISANGNTLSGGNGNDELEGGSGSDSLSGGAGDDVLIGDAGQDTLTGGTNGDDFEIDFDGVNNQKTITDFSRTENDKIVLDLEDFGGAALAGAVPASHIISGSYGSLSNGSNFSSTSAYFIVDTSGANARLFYDADSIGTASTAVLIATINGYTALGFDAGDFEYL